jgi:5-oxoprolinase (ATP-hydrolysing) subunit C
MASGRLIIRGGLPPRLVGLPKWGEQHLGYPPEGAQDQTSLCTVNTLLGQENLPCLEMMLPPMAVEFKGAGWLAVAGADHLLKIDGQVVSAGRVIRVEDGSKLSVQPNGLGARLYLQMAGGVILSEGEFLYDDLVECSEERILSEPDWWPESGVLRVLPGPEWDWLKDADLESVWRVDPRSDGQGLRLDGPVSGRGLNRDVAREMLSGPVFDGTVQLSPKGPICLLRGRQCVGGYPRVLQIIECDVDRLAQFLPGQLLMFQLVTLEEAQDLNVTYRSFLTSEN